MRWSRAGLDAALTTLAGAATGAHTAPPNLSIVLGGERDGMRDKHALYVQGRLLCSPATDGRLVRAVLRAGAVLATPPPDGALVLSAATVVAPDGSVVIVDGALHHDLRLVQSRLARTGFRILDCASVAVDPENAMVRIPDALAPWRVDRARLDTAFPPGPSDDDLGPLTARVTRVVTAVVAPPDSRAAAVAAAVSMLGHDEDVLHTADVERMAVLLEHAPPLPYVLTDPEPLLDLVTTSSRT